MHKVFVNFLTEESSPDSLIVVLNVKSFILALLMTFAPFVPIPAYLIYAVAKDGKQAFQPEPDWQAANAVDDSDHSGIGKSKFVQRHQSHALRKSTL